MAITNFIPEIWSANMLDALSKRLVSMAVTNQDYEGDASNGSAVNITSVDDPTVGTYTEHTDITIEAASDETRQLLLNQKKYFAVEVDDVERVQSVNGGALVSTLTMRGAYKLAATADLYTLSAMGTGASASAPDHQVAEATISTASDAYDSLVDWGVMLDDVDAPDFDRFVVVTPAFYGLLQKDDRFVAAGDAAGAAFRRNGIVGEAAGFTVLKSTQLPNGPGAGAGKSIIAGSRSATTFASQLVGQPKVFEQEKRFNQAVKALWIYGAKVTRPECLVSADVIVA